MNCGGNDNGTEYLISCNAPASIEIMKIDFVPPESVDIATLMTYSISRDAPKNIAITKQ